MWSCPGFFLPRLASKLTSNSGKVAPALAVGCTIVMKPSELTPLTALVSSQIHTLISALLLAETLRIGQRSWVGSCGPEFYLPWLILPQISPWCRQYSPFSWLCWRRCFGVPSRRRQSCLHWFNNYRSQNYGSGR